VSIIFVFFTFFKKKFWKTLTARYIHIFLVRLPGLEPG
jgi:hypothetical protein